MSLVCSYLVLKIWHWRNERYILGFAISNGFKLYFGEFSIYFMTRRGNIQNFPNTFNFILIFMYHFLSDASALFHLEFLFLWTSGKLIEIAYRFYTIFEYLLATFKRKMIMKIEFPSFFHLKMIHFEILPNHPYCKTIFRFFFEMKFRFCQPGYSPIGCCMRWPNYYISKGAIRTGCKRV